MKNVGFFVNGFFTLINYKGEEYGSHIFTGRILLLDNEGYSGEFFDQFTGRSNLQYLELYENSLKLHTSYWGRATGMVFSLNKDTINIWSGEFISLLGGLKGRASFLLTPIPEALKNMDPLLRVVCA